VARYRRFDTVTGEAGAGEKAPAGQPPDAMESDTMESVRMRRAGLKSALSALEIALAAPAPGRLEEWATGVRDATAALHEVWMRHVVETEAPGAFLDELVEAAPRLATPAQRLREEHAEILSVLIEVEERLQQRDLDEEWAERMRSVLTSVLVALARHRQRGADLVYEAYAVDIGGGF
jgi:hypothetical protein